MDITRHDYEANLGKLLQLVVKSHFVAFDFEFSGISKTDKWAKPVAASPPKGADGRQLLQARYDEVREAAEKYQILQVGITFVEQDESRGVYTLRPYNFHLSPVIEPRLDLERVWSYQSGAVAFLMANGFQMHLPFTEGVSYLSWREQQEIYRREDERENNKSQMPDIPASDLGARAFLAHVRKEVSYWLKLGKNGPSYLNIPASSPVDTPDSVASLTNLQRRLVYQVVRNEFPRQATAISRGFFIQIVPYDEKREEENKSKQVARLQSRVQKETGFRHLFDAIAGQNLSEVDPKIFLPSCTQMYTDNSGVSPLQRHINNFQKKLYDKTRVIAGHNVFTDLVNMYKCFIGPLPESVEVFAQQIHEIFPTIIDTKYMATSNCGSLNPASSLQDVHRALMEEGFPIVEIHHEHKKYAINGPLHEAGYDSQLTAEVAIKLAAQMKTKENQANEALNLPTDSEDDGYTTPAEELSQMWIKHLSSDSGSKKSQAQKTPTKAPMAKAMNGAQPNGKQPSSEATGQIIQKLPSDSSEESAPAVRSAFASKTMFDALARMDAEDNAAVSFQPKSKNKTKNKKKTSKRGGGAWFDDQQDDDDVDADQMVAEGRLMPQWNDEFWGVYGNKLRIFGTQENMLELR